ncbi:MAG: thiopurine S-methyltransferase [Kofleriaceae bacterium]
MEPAFWRARWAEHKTAFHEGHPNAFLEAHIARLDGRYRILVPLCGKTEDLAFLAANGHAVVGVELVEDAAAQFFAEHAIEPTIERRGDHAIYQHGELAIITGDFFTTTSELVGHVDGVYDRAALIALSPEARPRYIDHLRTLVAPGAWGIVIGIDYPEAEFEPPPYSVREAEIRGYYRAVERLAEARPVGGRIAASGLDAMERCYAVQIS